MTEKISLEILQSKLLQAEFGSCAGLDVIESIMDQHGMDAADSAIDDWVDARHADIIGRYVAATPVSDAWVKTGREPAYLPAIVSKAAGRPRKEYPEGHRPWIGPRRHSEIVVDLEEVA